METKIKNDAKTAEQRNPSSTYTIKSMKGLIKKLETLKMCTPAEMQTLKNLHRTIVERWIGGELMTGTQPTQSNH